MDSIQIGIVSNNKKSPWLKQLVEALGVLGEPTIYSEDSLDDEPDEAFDLIVVDASGLQMELASRVGWLHGRFTNVPIVVLTSSPTWRRAKAVLRAGAADYMPRSIEGFRLIERCRLLLSCPP